MTKKPEKCRCECKKYIKQHLYENDYFWNPIINDYECNKKALIKI